MTPQPSENAGDYRLGERFLVGWHGASIIAETDGGCPTWGVWSAAGERQAYRRDRTSAAWLATELRPVPVLPADALEAVE
jgi:hypothetical protein